MLFRTYIYTHFSPILSSQKTVAPAVSVPVPSVSERRGLKGNREAHDNMYNGRLLQAGQMRMNPSLIILPPVSGCVILGQGFVQYTAQ